MSDPTAIKLLVFDVDGVLTDGSIIVDDHGIESKRFFVRDGFAMKHAMALGLKIGVLSGRSGRAVTLRMEYLGIDLVVQGETSKGTALERLCAKAGVAEQETAYIGDDLIDLPALQRCGYPMAVADAVEEVKAAARYTTRAPGGRGAAREAIEHLLKAQGRWRELLEKYGL